MEAICWGEVSRWGKSRTDAFDFSFQHLTSACWLLLLRKQATRNNQLSQRTIAYTTIKTNKHTTIDPRMKLCLRFEGLVSCLYCLLVKSIWINTHSDLFSLFSSSNRAKQVSYDFIITLKTNSINKTYTLFVLYSTISLLLFDHSTLICTVSILWLLNKFTLTLSSDYLNDSISLLQLYLWCCLRSFWCGISAVVVLSGVLVDVLMVLGDREGVVKIDGCLW